MVNAIPTTLDLKVLWRNVSTARGTRTPAAKGLDVFLNTMEALPRERLYRALTVCRTGSELAQELMQIAWASACTHDLMPAKAKDAGMECAPHTLFAVGLWLIDKGGDPSLTLMRPQDWPAVIEQMIDFCSRSGVKTPSTGGAGTYIEPMEFTLTGRSECNGMSNAELGAKDFEAAAPYPSKVSISMSSPGPSNLGVATTQDSNKHLASLRLFGNAAAHTLEISKHRRAGNFLGVNVINIDSARGNSQGGFDWDNKLSIQLTPEEMPEVIAVLLGIRKEAAFSNHGSDRNKTVSFRNQDGGIVIVTGRRNDTYPVPVKTSVMYYLLDLFCCAMAGSSADRKSSDVIALVRGIYS